MKLKRWWAIVLLWTCLFLSAPAAYGAGTAGMYSTLPGAERWQPYLDQSPVDLSRAAEQPLEVLRAFFTPELLVSLRGTLKSYADVLLFLLLAAVLELLAGEDTDHDLLDLVCAGGCGVLLWEKLLTIAQSLCDQLEQWETFLLGFLPVYGGVLTMGGEPLAGAAAGGFFLMALCTLAKLLTVFLPPLLECYLALSMACCICTRTDLGRFCKAAGELMQKGLSWAGKLLAALIGFQRISAAQLDRTALRTGQFLTGTVPIVGQSLSDAAEAVLAGVQLLKSSLGFAAIFFLSAEFLPLYLGMLIQLGGLAGCSLLCSLTGNERGQALMECFSEAVRCMMACIALFFGLAVMGTAFLSIAGGG